MHRGSSQDSTLSPELALLCAHARLTMDPERHETTLARLQQDIDWTRLAWLAHSHGLIPLLHHHCAEGALLANWIPAETREQAAHEATAIARRNLHLTNQLIIMLRELEAHDIPVVPLKGPVLASLAYGSIALRRINDLDLFFHEADLQRAVARLFALGYQSHPNYPVTLTVLNRQSAHHVTVFAPDLSHRVELHVCLSPPIGNTRITFETIAPSLQRQSYFGVSMLTLPPEEMLVYLSLHGSSHVWERLEWLCCVAQLLRSGTMEWDRVHAFATRLNGVRRVQAAGYIVQALLGDRVPHPLQTSDRWVHSATRFVVRRLAEERTSQKRSVGAFLFQLRTDSCHTARMQRVRAILFTAHSGDMAAVRLPPFLRVLYQLVRPIRLLWKHGRNIVRRGWIRSVTDS